MALFNIELRRVVPNSEYLTGIYEVYHTVLDGYQRRRIAMKLLLTLIYNPSSDLPYRIPAP